MITRKLAVIGLIAVPLTIFANVSNPSGGTTGKKDTQMDSTARSVSEAKDLNQAAPLDNTTVREIQQALNQKGYSVGQADGVLTSKTTEALTKFQKAKGLTATGSPNQETLAALGVKVPGNPTVSPNAPISGGAPAQPGSPENTQQPSE